MWHRTIRKEDIVEKYPLAVLLTSHRETFVCLSVVFFLHMTARSWLFRRWIDAPFPSTVSPPTRDAPCIDRPIRRWWLTPRRCHQGRRFRLEDKQLIFSAKQLIGASTLFVCCCCSRTTDWHNQIRGHRTGSCNSWVEGYPRDYIIKQAQSDTRISYSWRKSCMRQKM